MSSYGKFATIYDELMQDVPYDKYVDWITSHAPSKQYSKLLDVGCGTGKLAIKLHQSGYEVSGIDLSEEMLSIANERMQTSGVNIPLYAMSMDELEGFKDFDIITIPIDSINYLFDDQAVCDTLERVYHALRDGGQLFFDVHSIYKMDHIFLESPFTYDNGEMTYLWYTEKGEFDHSIEHLLTFFVKDLNTDLFERFDEEHFQRSFPIETYVHWLNNVGFSEIVVTADWTEDAPKEESERIFIRAIK